MKAARNKTPDWPFDVDLVCRKLGLRYKSHEVVIDVLAQTLQALGYPAKGVRRSSVGQMQKNMDTPDGATLFVKEQSQCALVLGELVMDSGLRRGWDAVLLQAHRNLMPSFDHFGVGHEWRTNWTVALESTTEDREDRSPALVAQAVRLARQHRTEGWSMPKAIEPVLHPSGFPLVTAEGEFEGDLDLSAGLMAAVFPETVTSTWKLGKALEEVMTHLQGKSLETEGFTRTVETIEPRCPNTVVGDTSLFLQFADHQAHTATPSAMDRGYFRTPSAPVQIRPVQVKMLKPIKPNKNSPPSPLDVGTSGLARQLLQVHFHNTLPQAPPANRKLRM